ncbi:hypothetical protein CC78DRAFT_534417 [Lojkania enalia]|uniref:Uncharacterized protein n=1 Tax=Lojkania enalia TaxID=147567 RepID=A0A9P4N7T2_9PLEO|nr:hypothetical protein CC78DRAFT_534417 [Didymosphaeria enalia]
MSISAILHTRIRSPLFIYNSIHSPYGYITTPTHSHPCLHHLPVQLAQHLTRRF